MIRKILIQALFFVIFSFNHQIKAEDKIGFIDLTYLFNNSNVGKSINKEIKSRNDKINSEFNDYKKKIEKEKKTLLAQKNVIADEEYRKQLIQLEKNIKEYNSIILKKRNELSKLNNKVRTDFSNKLRPVLEEYSKENSIGMIIRKENLLIGKNTLDLTKGILEIFNKKVKKISIQ
tara:strand:+ start:958 stop:1485 length:528 start_codon:yes stop_codon:yes gene_type:complete